MDDEYVLNYFYTNKEGNLLNRLSRYKVKHIPDDISEYLKNRYSDNTTDDIHEIIYRIKNNIEIAPKCPICGGKLIFKRYYPITCSSKCIGKKSYLSQIAATGIKNLFDVHREKTNETMLKKYGVLNCSQSDKVKEKKENTFLKHYGVKNNFGRKEVMDKNIETIKNNKEEILEKRRKTNQEKYGVDYYLSLNKGKNLADSHKKKIGIAVKSKEFQKQRMKSMKEHGTVNTSRAEEAFYKYFSERYNNVERQYKSEKYPFYCDFYIKDIDTYIEIQGSQFHHFHPFDPDNIDNINELERLKRLADDEHPQYNNIIECWTVLDPMKRKIAKDNKLNFIEIYPNDYCKYPGLYDNIN